MGKKLNLLGQRFGRWTVIKEGIPRNGRTTWLCRCECGTEHNVQTSDLTGGKSQSCGCLQRERTAQACIKNLVGQRFNRLVVESQTKERKGGMIVWHCKCDCGNYIDVPTSYLTTGDTSSCGCYLKERIRETHMIDITNQRFGYLLALRPTEEKRGVSKDIIWECKCDCGNTTCVSSRSLRTGMTVSCGCVKSKGERRIADLLRNAGIPFETQKSFSDCRFPNTNALAHFDFYVDNSYLIEYDGEQHFSENHGWNKESLESRQKRDSFKNNWCKEKGITLIRIPYTHYDKLNLQDLLPKTTTFDLA